MQEWDLMEVNIKMRNTVQLWVVSYCRYSSLIQAIQATKLDTDRWMVEFKGSLM